MPFIQWVMATHNIRQDIPKIYNQILLKKIAVMMLVPNFQF